MSNNDTDGENISIPGWFFPVSYFDRAAERDDIGTYRYIQDFIFAFCQWTEETI